MLDDFDDNELNQKYWIPTYLPQWSSREKSMPSYRIENSTLTLYISDEQKPWCPKYNGKVRVSNLQTGVFSGKLGESIGQHHFTDNLSVEEYQETEFKVTPTYGRIEFKAKCNISKENVAAMWLIGLEEEQQQSAEICLFELKGWNVGKKSSIIGYGLRAFKDSKLKDEFFEEEFNLDVSEWNVYSFIWDSEKITFYFNNVKIRVIKQSPEYPMQIMLNLYDIENIKNEKNTFEIDYVLVE